MIKVGDKLPDATLFEDAPDNPVSIAELCKGKTVLIFGVPGAFTPGCSKTHLPGYVEKAGDLKAKGIDEIVCIAVNDPFVTAAWAKEQKAAGKVRLLSDAQAQLTKALGLELHELVEVLGNVRCRRFSMLVRDGVVEQLQVEPDGKGLTCTLAESMISKLTK